MFVSRLSVVAALNDLIMQRPPLRVLATKPLPEAPAMDVLRVHVPDRLLCGDGLAAEVVGWLQASTGDDALAGRVCRGTARYAIDFYDLADAMRFHARWLPEIDVLDAYCPNV